MQEFAENQEGRGSVSAATGDYSLEKRTNERIWKLIVMANSKMELQREKHYLELAKVAQTLRKQRIARGEVSRDRLDELAEDRLEYEQSRLDKLLAADINFGVQIRKCVESCTGNQREAECQLFDQLATSFSEIQQLRADNILSSEKLSYELAGVIARNTERGMLDNQLKQRLVRLHEVRATLRCKLRVKASEFETENKRLKTDIAKLTESESHLMQKCSAARSGRYMQILASNRKEALILADTLSRAVADILGKQGLGPLMAEGRGSVSAATDDYSLEKRTEGVDEWFGNLGRWMDRGPRNKVAGIREKLEAHLQVLQRLKRVRIEKKRLEEERTDLDAARLTSEP